MLKYLSPRVVVVYGAMPSVVFEEFRNSTQFIHFEDYISSKKGFAHHG